MSLASEIDCWFLTGPTASGKTSISIELARLIDAEIVSLDSMALYRCMDIGTAKPTIEERSEVPHHMIDVIEPSEEFSVSQYVESAQLCVDKIRTHNHKILFVGGTPLYLKAMLRGLFKGPPADWAFRKRLEQEALEHGPESIQKRLAEVDPDAAKRLHPNDTRRLIRALEVYEKTGHPISQLQQQFETAIPADACRVFVLDWPRSELYARINRRVDLIFEAGLVDEVRKLLAESPSLGNTAQQAVGYRETIDYIEGKSTLVETIELVKRHTRQFAKRQCTWFRSLGECRFIPMATHVDPKQKAQQIVDTHDVNDRLPP